MHELRADPELTLAQALDRLSPCDLVLIEGYKTAPIPKLEVWRAGVGKPRLYPGDPHIVALATDAPGNFSPGLPVMDLSRHDEIATFVWDHAAARRVAD
jgi:molybdopterin-guanine dinucleotide biosynthesis protein B